MPEEYEDVSNPELAELYQLRPLSEIIPRLWQGMRPKTYEGYALVVSCEQHLAKKPMEDYSGVMVHCPMRDEDDFEISETNVMAAASAAHWVLRQDSQGKVFVHCSGGLNRSSVVTARILELLGHNAHEAVRIIRESHDEFALCNRQFERWVLRDVLPIAETSAFRILDEDGA